MLHNHATLNSLGFARIVVFGLAAFSRIACPLWEISSLPEFESLGVMKLLGASVWASEITFPVAVGIQVLTIVLLLAVAAGIGPFRWTAPLACFAFTVSEGLLRGLGHVPHKYMILLLMTYILCLFPAADALSLTRWRTWKAATKQSDVARGALVSASLIFCMTYMMVGARRLAAGGLDIYFDDTILVMIAKRAAEMGAAGGWGIWACESFTMGWLLRIGFPIVTVFELLSPLCLFSSRFRWLWLAVMIPFHLGAGVLMGIWFNYNLALMPLLIAGFNPFHHKARSLTLLSIPPRVEGHHQQEAA